MTNKLHISRAKLIFVRQMIQFHVIKLKMPILNGGINDFKFARLLLARSIDRSIDNYNMLNIGKMNQYFYVREDENRLMADSHLTARRNTDSFR